MSEQPPSKLYSEKALNRLQSPEQLDRLFGVTTPAGWAGMIAVLILILSGAIWCFFGVMATKVSGTGLIVDAAGIVNVFAPHGGRVTEFKTEAGQGVQKGQVIAVMEPYTVEQGSVRLKAGLNNAPLTDTLQREGRIVAPFSGVVTEMKVNSGDVVTAGTPLLSLRLSQGKEELKVLLYVPVLEGKKVQPGMTVQLSTGVADSNDYGYLLGTVNRVSSYPVSAAEISSWAGGKEITQWILQRGGGAVMEVHVDLMKDQEAVSGYLWSSIAGDPRKLSAGTACTGTIVVNRQTPAAKVFRKLNQWLRND